MYMTLNTTPEILKGVTDLPIAALALIFGLLLAKKDVGKGWRNLFFLIAVAGVLGAFAHIFDYSPLIYEILWTILYILLFELIRRFAGLMVCYIIGEDRGEMPLVFILEGVIFAVTVLCLFLAPFNEIYIFVVFATIMFLRLIVCLVRCQRRPRLAVILIVSLSAPLAAQILEDVLPYAIVIEHILIAAVMFLAYRIGAEAKTR